MHRTQLYLRIWTRIVFIISHKQYTTALQVSNIYRSELYHMHKTQLHLRFWTRIVLNYLTCTVHTCTSGFEDVSSWIISHAQNTTTPQDLNTYRPVLPHKHRTQLHLRTWTRHPAGFLVTLHRFSVMAYKINLTVEIIHIDNVLFIHKAINLALDKAQAHGYKMLPI